MAKQATLKEAVAAPEAAPEEVEAEVVVEETAVATSPGNSETALTTQAAVDDDGFEDFDDKDMVIPRAAIPQATSDKAKGTPGMICVNLTGEEYEKIPVVILRHQKGKVLYPEEYKKGDEAICWSRDAVVPGSTIEKPMATSCKECPYGQWKKVDGKNIKPDCSDTRTLLCVDTGTFVPFFISLHGLSIKPLNGCMTAIKLRGKAAGLPLWGYSTVIGVQTMETNHGDKFAASFAGPQPLDPEMVEVMTAFRNELSRESIEDTEAAEKAAGVGGDSVATEAEEDF